MGTPPFFPRTPNGTAPQPPAGVTATGPSPGAAQPTSKTLDQHLRTLAEGGVMTPAELHEFLESLRSICSGLAFFVHAGASQLDAAARKGSRDASDGRMTLAQKVKLKVVLRRMGRQLNSGSAEALLDAAKGAVRTYALMEDFLEELESAQTQRPHRSARGGFDPFGGK